jgi:hypothetical protein
MVDRVVNEWLHTSHLDLGVLGMNVGFMGVLEKVVVEKGEGIQARPRPSRPRPGIYCRL